MVNKDSHRPPCFPILYIPVILIITTLEHSPCLYKAAFTLGQHVARQHVACCRQQNCCQFVARLLLDTKGYMLPRYRQYVAGNKQHVAGQHVALV